MAGKSDASVRDHCIFCKIYDAKEDTNILYKDENIVIFPDRRPAAKHHYLVVTREHIKDSKILNKEQLPLLENLIQRAERILEERGADMNDTRYGFHWPPFHTVSHLHLHAISPASQMAFIPRVIFKPDSWWFVSPQYVLQRLAKL